MIDKPRSLYYWMTLHSSSNAPDPVQVAAATLIQRLWRGKTNNARRDFMNAEIRWDDALTQAKLTVDRAAAEDGANSPQKRWKRAVFMIGRLRDKNPMLSGVADNFPPVEAEDKHLERQHWLELVDAKHRYGSNLKWYHSKWQEEDTTENFFKWLDHGGGKDLSLSECPRDRLESERILYLSAEQRLNYLVKISNDGKLLWARNNQPIDTTPGHWKDGGDGRGIIPRGLPSLPQGRSSLKRSVASNSTDDSSHEQANAATHYIGQTKGRYAWIRLLRRTFTPRGIVERLLRKTVWRNTWIYVSDKNFNIFVGIKETGAFQHSSFTAGGLVTSAGLITVKQGVIHTLSPLSGHYRTSVDHFHKFLDVLAERGVDMRKVRISKAEAALWGIEHINKWKKKQRKIVYSGKKKVRDAKSNIAAVPSVWKREILEGRKRASQTLPTDTEKRDTTLKKDTGDSAKRE